MINDVLFWIVGILWFVDEIETLIDLKKFGIEREKNPIARFFVEHGPMVFTVFKIISFSIFVFLIKTIQLFDSAFSTVILLIVGVAYLLVDIRNYKII